MATANGVYSSWNLAATLSALSANTNDLDVLSSGNMIAISSTTAVDLTGILASNALSGSRLFMRNSGSFTITLRHASSSSAAANRFSFPNSKDYPLTAGDRVELYYDGSSWRRANPTSLVLVNGERVENPTDGTINFMPDGVSSTHFGVRFDFTGWGYGPSLYTVRASDGNTSSGIFRLMSNVAVADNVYVLVGNAGPLGFVNVTSYNSKQYQHISIQTHLNASDRSGILAISRNPQTSATNENEAFDDPHLRIYSGDNTSGHYVDIYHAASVGHVACGTSTLIISSTQGGWVFSGTNGSDAFVDSTVATDVTLDAANNPQNVVRYGGTYLRISEIVDARLLIDSFEASSNDVYAGKQITVFNTSSSSMAALNDVGSGDGVIHSPDSLATWLAPQEIAQLVWDSTLAQWILASRSLPVRKHDVSVNFGTSFTDYVTTTVTDCKWATGQTQITVSAKSDITAAEAMDFVVHQFQFAISDVVTGVGFTLHVYTPVKAKGTYTFTCTGV